MNDWLRLAVGVVTLTCLTVGVLRLAEVSHGRSVIVATLRAAGQLGVVALALRGVFAEPVNTCVLGLYPA